MLCGFGTDAGELSNSFLLLLLLMNLFLSLTILFALLLPVRLPSCVSLIRHLNRILFVTKNGVILSYLSMEFRPGFLFNRFGLIRSCYVLVWSEFVIFEWIESVFDSNESVGVVWKLNRGEFIEGIEWRIVEEKRRRKRWIKDEESGGYGGFGHFT